MCFNCRARGLQHHEHNSGAGGADANRHDLVEFGCVLDQLDIFYVKCLAISSSTGPQDVSVFSGRSEVLAACGRGHETSAVLRSLQDCRKYFVVNGSSCCRSSVASMLYRS